MTFFQFIIKFFFQAYDIGIITKSMTAYTAKYLSKFNRLFKHFSSRTIGLVHSPMSQQRSGKRNAPWSKFERYEACSLLLVTMWLFRLASQANAFQLVLFKRSLFGSKSVEKKAKLGSCTELTTACSS